MVGWLSVGFCCAGEMCVCKIEQRAMGRFRDRWIGVKLRGTVGALGGGEMRVVGCAGGAGSFPLARRRH